MLKNVVPHLEELDSGKHAVHPGGAGGLIGGLAAGESFLEDHRVDYD